MLGLCGTYVRLMLAHVGLLDAMLGPYSCHVELMLSQERRVPFLPLPGPKGTHLFWIMSGPCWAHLVPLDHLQEPPSRVGVAAWILWILQLRWNMLKPLMNNMDASNYIQISSNIGDADDADPKVAMRPFWSRCFGSSMIHGSDLMYSKSSVSRV